MANGELKCLFFLNEKERETIYSKYFYCKLCITHQIQKGNNLKRLLSVLTTVFSSVMYLSGQEKPVCVPPSPAVDTASGRSARLLPTSPGLLASLLDVRCLLCRHRQHLQGTELVLWWGVLSTWPFYGAVNQPNLLTSGLLLHPNDAWNTFGKHLLRQE